MTSSFKLNTRFWLAIAICLCGFLSFSQDDTSTIKAQFALGVNSPSSNGFVSNFDADVSKREVLNAFEIKLNNLVTSVDEIKKDKESLTVYPNPTADRSTIEFNLSSAKNVNLVLRDITGKEILVEDFGKLSAGSQKIVLNAAPLTNGIYFVSIQIGEEVVTKKISVNR